MFLLNRSWLNYRNILNKYRFFIYSVDVLISHQTEQANTQGVSQKYAFQVKDFKFVVRASDKTEWPHLRDKYKYIYIRICIVIYLMQHSKKGSIFFLFLEENGILVYTFSWIKGNQKIKTEFRKLILKNMHTWLLCISLYVS